MKDKVSKTTRPKAYSELSAISTKLTDSTYELYKVKMARFKDIYGKSFSLSDLVSSILAMPESELDVIVDRFLKAKSFSLDEKMTTISSEARAKIEAILAEEAMKKG